ncbi:MAG: RHS repeat-associated core domain-containing protein [Polyangiaceae bacterium]
MRILRCWMSVLCTLVLLLSCASGPGNDELGTSQGALTYCRQLPFTSYTTSSGPQPQVWTNATPILVQIPNAVAVSSNMPAGFPYSKPIHTLELGTATPSGGFNIASTCTYQGKTFLLGQYYASLVSCTFTPPNYALTIDKARLQTSWPVNPTPSTTWSVTASLGEIYDDENSCTVDTCNAGGATHVYNPGIPGCAVPPPPTTPSDTALPSNPSDDAAVLFTAQGGTAGALVPARAAVVRGMVYVNTSGTAVPAEGASVSVLRHPEYGVAHTHSAPQAPGTFEIAVNGGEVVTLVYSLPNTLGLQRQVETHWNTIDRAPDVELAGLSSVVTTIGINDGTWRTAAGVKTTTAQDAEGERTARIFFPPFTTSSFNPPSGTLNVRLTEYTIGANGMRRMPGNLPPQVGYNYAFAATIDEALAAGVSRVDFSNPLPFYVENFPGYPVGSIVPFGTYDRSAGAWVAEANGRIVKCLRIDGQYAKFDIAGVNYPQDTEASDAETQAFGMTDLERKAFADAYGAAAIGKSYWRVTLQHFTDYDANWGVQPPDGAAPPTARAPQPEVPIQNSCTAAGSIIECQNQVLREEIPVAHTPFTLVHSSERTLARRQRVRVWLTGDVSPSPAPAAIDWQVLVAGQLMTGTWPNMAPNQYIDVQWDGNDVFGRRVQGEVPVYVRVGNRYEGVRTTASASSSFGLNAGATPVITGNRAGGNFTYWAYFTTSLGGYVPPKASLGGWSLDVHHVFERGANGGRAMVFEGNGARRYVGESTVETIAGCDPTSQPVGYGDGGQAGAARLEANAIAVGPDGAIYLAEATYFDPMFPAFIRKIRLDGVIERIAGAEPVDAALVDNANALHAPVHARFMAMSPAGELHFVELNHNQVWKIGLDAKIHLVAGTGAQCLGLGNACGDGHPATLATFNDLSDITFDREGNLFVADTGDHRVRRIGLDGNVTPATSVTSGLPYRWLSLDERGEVLAQEENSKTVYRIDPTRQGATLTTLIGAGRCGEEGEGFAPIGRIFETPFADTGIVCPSHLSLSRGWRTLMGLIGKSGYSGDGGPARSALFAQLIHADLGNRVAFHPDGSILVLDQGGSRLRRVAVSGALRTPTGFRVPSEDGSQVFEFNGAGRHVTTRTSRTGALVYQFDYDANGLLTSITDSHNQVTTIARNATSIVITAPHQQTTTLTTTGGGYATQITEPTRVWNFVPSAEGLLTQLTDPANGVHNFEYNVDGLLTGDQNADGSWQRLSRTRDAIGYGVSLTSGQGRVRSYRVNKVTDDIEYRFFTAPGGVTTSQSIVPDTGMTVSNAPDGTTTTLTTEPDPRYGFLAPTTNTDTVLPSGARLLTTESRASVLATIGDPLSLQTETRTVSMNVATCNGGSQCTKIQTQDVFDRSTGTITRTTPEQRTSTTHLDPVHEYVTQRSVPGIASVYFTYDTEGRLKTISQGARTTTLDYYATSGALRYVTDPLGRTTEYTRDPLGRVTSVAMPGGRTLGIGYDVMGNVETVTPPGKPNHGQDFDSRNLMTLYDPPSVAGMTGSKASTYTYDLDKLLTQETVPGTTTTTIAYNRASTTGLLSSVVGDYTRTITRNAANQVTGISSTDGNLSYEYDGALLKETKWTVGASNWAVTHAFNNHFARSSTTIAGAVETWSYDNDGLLTGATGIGTAISLGRDASNGRITGTTVGNIAETRSYDPTYGELSSLAYTTNGSPLYSVTYSRDAIGRVTDKVEVASGVTTSTHYEYTAAGQLASEAVNGGPATIYSYDLNGNRTTPSGVYDNQDRQTNAGVTTTFLYNNAGARTKRTVSGVVTNYTWDRFGNLRTMMLPASYFTVAYGYDGQERRVTKFVSDVQTNRWLYDGQNRIVAELNGSNVVVRRFVYTSRGNVPDTMVDSTGTYRFVTDQLGSVRYVIAPNGSIAQSTTYDAWGKVVSHSVSPANFVQPFGFAGGVYDSHTGFVHFGARDYDPATGRWVSKDPARWGGGLNLYEYAGSDPVNFIDVNGRAASLAVQFIAFAARAGAVGGGWGTAAMAAVGPAVLAVSFLYYGLGPGPSAEASATYPAAPASGLPASASSAPLPDFDIAKGGGKNVADTGIQQEVVDAGLQPGGPDACEYLRSLYQAAKCAGDSARAQKIKSTQKAWGCRRSGQQ